jgi:hypothetical protein
MKTQKSFSRRLKLSKETIARLGDKNMNEVKGGVSTTMPCCPPTHQNPCNIEFTEGPISVCC